MNYKDVSWRTPELLCITPIQNASILPSGRVFNATAAYSFGKWYWNKESDDKHSALTHYEESFISFVQIWQDTFQHVAFDTYPKSRLLCSYMQRHQEIGILVKGDLQRDLIIESCSIDKKRFKNLVKTISAASISTTVWLGDFKMGIVPPDSFASLGPQNKRGQKVIYLPRQGTKRSVSNEKDVLELLRTFFKEKLIVYSPKNDWREDQTVFELASIIIGPHGGALANMIFAPANTTIIEFLPLTELKKKGENERPCYFGLARGMGFNYHAVEPVNFGFDTPMTIPLDELTEILNS